MKSDWKAWFPPRIMENGVDDYESGAVIDRKTTDGGYEAIVLGSREYHVEIEINGEDISGMYCDCAYADDGSFCRHMAAALCEVTEQEEDQAEEEQEPGACTLAEAVSALPETYVRGLLVDLARQDEMLRRKLFREYEDQRRHRRQEGIRRELCRIRKRYTDMNEIVDEKQTESYVETMKRLLRMHTDLLIERGDHLSAFELVCAVFVQSGNQELSEAEGHQLAQACSSCWEKIAAQGGSGVRLIMKEWLIDHGSDGTVNPLFEACAERFMRKLTEQERSGSLAGCV